MLSDTNRSLVIIQEVVVAPPISIDVKTKIIKANDEVNVFF